MPDAFTEPNTGVVPIVRIGAHATEIGVIAEGLGQEMLKTLVRALLIEVGRETARHIAQGHTDALGR